MDEDKLLLILHGEIKTPPMSIEARIKTGFLLRKLQQGKSISTPYSKRIKEIGPRCHELRIKDSQVDWRIIYRIDDDAIVIAEVFKKKSQKIPKRIIDVCKQRLSHYDSSYDREQKDIGHGP